MADATLSGRRWLSALLWSWWPLPNLAGRAYVPGAGLDDALRMARAHAAGRACATSWRRWSRCWHDAGNGRCAPTSTYTTSAMPS
ncbi:MAG: hypothetical protein IPF94_12425 [Betaproteobacteria bacterium]|nr:hypothetical protein [Betaproteobacteria bacterium]